MCTYWKDEKKRKNYMRTVEGEIRLQWVECFVHNNRVIIATNVCIVSNQCRVNVQRCNWNLFSGILGEGAIWLSFRNLICSFWNNFTAFCQKILEKCSIFLLKNGFEKWSILKFYRNFFEKCWRIFIKKLFFL